MGSTRAGSCRTGDQVVPPSVTRCDGPRGVGALVIPHVHHQRAAQQLHHLAFIDGRTDDAAQPPVLSMVVAEDHVGSVTGLIAIGRSDGMIAGDQEPSLAGTLRQLNADARTGRVPPPLGGFHGRRDLSRLGPGQAVVVAVRRRRPAACPGPRSSRSPVPCPARGSRSSSSQTTPVVRSTTGQGLPQVFAPSSQTIWLCSKSFRRRSIVSGANRCRPCRTGCSCGLHKRPAACRRGWRRGRESDRCRSRPCHRQKADQLRF